MTNRSFTNNWSGRSLLLFSSALCISPLFGQVNMDALRAKYGPPIEEVFAVRPGITLTATYGDNHQVCKLDIRPTRNATSVIPASMIEAILNEIVPPLTRGTPKQQSQMGACCSSTEYEKVSITVASSDVTPNPDLQTQSSLAVVQFKSCQAAK